MSKSHVALDTSQTPRFKSNSVVDSNQYFSSQVVPFSTFGNDKEGKPSNIGVLVGAVGIEIRVSSILRDLRSTAGNGKKQLSI
jgi:hypothetical protein